MRKLIILGAVIFSLVCVVAGQEVAERDLNGLEGGTWVGELTYLDYGSGKRTSIKSNVSVTKKAAGTWTFAYVYPDEPKANGSSDVMLSADGKTFNGQTVIERTPLADGGVRIVATKAGDDNKKKATFRYTYLIMKNAFSIRKDVQYVGESEWFERNTYSWSR